MTQVFAEPDEANLDHLLYSDDPIISAFSRWLLTETGPDDWHRVVEGWNWDAGEDPLWWIVTRPDCDKATALLVFWKAEPHHYLNHPAWETVDPEDYDLYHTIRARWAAGFYTRSTLAFDLERDVGRIDFEAYRSRFGALVEAVLPLDMRTLPGRRLDGRSYLEGIPARFWDGIDDGDDWDEELAAEEDEDGARMLS